MKQPSAPASVVGTANPFSGEITEALVKSHRHWLAISHFLLKRKSGVKEAQDSVGRRQKRSKAHGRDG